MECVVVTKSRHPSRTCLTIVIMFIGVCLSNLTGLRAQEVFDTPVETMTGFKPPAEIIPHTDDQLMIDLGTALHLAESQNPRIALAREMVTESVAQHREARALWLPTLNAGGNYHLHGGVVQTSFGEIRRLNSQSLYVGGGSNTVGTQTVAVPAVRIFAHVGDAYYLPLAARQMVTVRSFESRTTDNVTLLEVCDRYLTLVASEARREALIATLQEVSIVERAQAVFARVGQEREADYHRAKTERLLLEVAEQQAQEDIAVAAAELSRVLHLDPSCRLVTSSGPIELLDLVDKHAHIDDLVGQAQHLRPEVAARNAEIGAADSRLRNEQMRPWLPQISAGFSGGAFGGGSNRQDLGVSSIYQTTAGRTDFDVWAFWTVQNLGAGNHAWQNIRRSERDQLIFSRALALAQIRREVTEQQAQARARRRAVDVAWTQLTAAEKGAQQELRRTRAGEALPIEALNNITRLSDARQRLLASVIDYNRAELRLLVALGTNPQDVAMSVNQ
ncbi:TolC family protein [Schlesneria paludicola]|uniref:TolC family protein n=1 Tax=Schlesneria paludicola TaxID=360056 RepID=UPI00029B4A0A|nr:TolC family protein [Schlesneria paludicola]